MIEVHLIGYTADLKHLVLDVDATEERGRYRLVVDGDLFATLDDVRQQRWEDGLDVGVWSPEAEDEVDEADDELEDDEAFELAGDVPAVDEDEGEDVQTWDDEDQDELGDDLLFDHVAQDEPLPEDEIQAFEATEVSDGDPLLNALIERASSVDEDSAPSVRLVEAPEAVLEPELEDDPEDAVDAAWDEGEVWEDEEIWEGDDVEVEADAAEAPVLETDIPAARQTALPSQLAKRHTAEGLEIPANAKLGPAEIQAELRKGKSVRAVAKAAGTDPAWVKRWLQPIQAEQSRIIEQAGRMIVVNKKGQASALPLADALAIRLGRKNIDPAGATWDAVRRDDGTWRVSCKFEEKGRMRTASWLWARGEAELSPASELAREVGWVDRRLARNR